MPQPPFFIDCDTGRDDALALLAVLSLRLPLAGVIASYGNTLVGNVADNTARILHLGNADHVPLFMGANGPSRPHSGFTGTVLPRQKVSGNGLCNLVLEDSGRQAIGPLEPDALAHEIVRLSEQHGPLEYVILGPASNFAALCAALGQNINTHIRRVTMMGGKFGSLWDLIPGADFNLIADPYAVQTVMEAGLELRFVPMNATWPVFLPLAEVEALIPQDPIAETVKNLMLAHLRHFAPEPVFRFHDPCVILAILEPSAFRDVVLSIDCDETSADFGRLSETREGYEAQLYATDEIRQRIFLQQLLDCLGLRHD